MISPNFLDRGGQRDRTASSGEIRPSGRTEVASIQIAPAPRVANPWSRSQDRAMYEEGRKGRTPIWTRCQSVLCPSLELYWHMGDYMNVSGVFDGKC
jgi:hypothetical protein